MSQINLLTDVSYTGITPVEKSTLLEEIQPRDFQDDELPISSNQEEAGPWRCIQSLDIVQQLFQLAEDRLIAQYRRPSRAPSVVTPHYRLTRSTLSVSLDNEESWHTINCSNGFVYAGRYTRIWNFNTDDSVGGVRQLKAHLNEILDLANRTHRYATGQLHRSRHAEEFQKDGYAPRRRRRARERGDGDEASLSSSSSSSSSESSSPRRRERRYSEESRLSPENAQISTLWQKQQDRIHHLEEENNTLRHAYQQAEAQLQHLQELTDAQRDEAARLQSRLSEKEAEIYRLRADHQQQIEPLQAQLRAAETAKTDLEHQLEALEHSQHELERERDSLSQRMTSLNRANSSLKKKFSSRKKELNESRRTIHRLTTAKTSISNQLREAQKANKDLLQRLRNLTHESNQLKSANERLQNRYQKTESELHRLQELITSQDRVEAALQRRLSETAQELEQLRSQLGANETRLQELAASQSAIKRERDSLLDRVDLLETENSTLSTRLRELTESLKNSQATISRLEAEKTTTSQRLQANEAKITRLSRELKRASEERAKTDEENTSLHRILGDLTNESDRLHAEKRHIEEELRSAKERLRSLQTQSENTIHSLREQIAALKDILTNRDRILEELTQAQSAREQELLRLREQSGSQQARIATLEGTIRETEASLARLTALIDADEAQRTSLTEQLTQTTEEVEALQISNRSLNQIKERLEAELEALRAELSRLQSTQSSQEEVANELRRSLSRKSEQHTTSEQENTRLRTSIEGLQETFSREISNIRRDRDAIRVALERLQGEYEAHLSSLRTQIEIERSTHADRLTETDQEIARVEADLRQITRELERVQTLNQSQTELLQLSTTREDSLRKELQKYQRHLSMLVSERARLRQRVKALERKNSRAAEELSQVRGSLSSAETANEALRGENSLLQTSEERLAAELRAKNKEILHIQEELESVKQTRGMQEQRIHDLNNQLRSLQEATEDAIRAHESKKTQLLAALTDAETKQRTQEATIEALRREVASHQQQLQSLQGDQEQRIATLAHQKIQAEETTLATRRQLAALEEEIRSLKATNERLELTLATKERNAAAFIEDAKRTAEAAERARLIELEELRQVVLTLQQDLEDNSEEATTALKSAQAAHDEMTARLRNEYADQFNAQEEFIRSLRVELSMAREKLCELEYHYNALRQSITSPLSITAKDLPNRFTAVRGGSAGPAPTPPAWVLPDQEPSPLSSTPLPEEQVAPLYTAPPASPNSPSSSSETSSDSPSTSSNSPRRVISALTDSAFSAAKPGASLSEEAARALQIKDADKGIARFNALLDEYQGIENAPALIDDKLLKRLRIQMSLINGELRIRYGFVNDHKDTDIRLNTAKRPKGAQYTPAIFFQKHGNEGPAKEAEDLLIEEFEALRQVVAEHEEALKKAEKALSPDRDEIEALTEQLNEGLKELKALAKKIDRHLNWQTIYKYKSGKNNENGREFREFYEIGEALFHRPPGFAQPTENLPETTRITLIVEAWEEFKKLWESIVDEAETELQNPDIQARRTQILRDIVDLEETIGNLIQEIRNDYKKCESPKDIPSSLRKKIHAKEGLLETTLSQLQNKKSELGYLSPCGKLITKMTEEGRYYLIRNLIILRERLLKYARQKRVAPTTIELWNTIRQYEQTLDRLGMNDPARLQNKQENAPLVFSWLDTSSLQTDKFKNRRGHDIVLFPEEWLENPPQRPSTNSRGTRRVHATTTRK